MDKEEGEPLTGLLILMNGLQLESGEPVCVRHSPLKLSSAQAHRTALSTPLTLNPVRMAMLKSSHPLYGFLSYTTLLATEVAEVKGSFLTLL